MSREEDGSSSSSVSGDRVPSRYLILSGAKVNAGDFLIRRRSVELISSARPGAQLRVHDRWRPLDEVAIGWADAVLLCGGPALQPHLYPGIYPLASPLERIKAPIIGIGLGWKGVPGDQWSERTYHFSRSSLRLLRRIERNGWPISCRDPATERVLMRHGIRRTALTGDPAWFDLERIGSSFRPPDPGGPLLFSMPASPIFFDQALDLIRALREEGRIRRVVAGFNHGWTKGEHVGAGRAAGFQELRDAVTAVGVEALDLSGGVEPLLDAASRCEIHVGYRLHTHLLFLSRRRPSILLEEDGRGSAAGEALGLPGIRAWRRPAPIRPILSAMAPAGRALRPLQHRLQRLIRPDESAIPRALALLRRHRSEAFGTFAQVAETIERAYRERMRPFLESLP